MGAGDPCVGEGGGGRGGLGDEFPRKVNITAHHPRNHPPRGPLPSPVTSEEAALLCFLPPVISRLSLCLADAPLRHRPPDPLCPGFFLTDLRVSPATAMAQPECCPARLLPAKGVWSGRGRGKSRGRSRDKGSGSGSGSGSGICLGADSHGVCGHGICPEQTTQALARHAFLVNDWPGHRPVAQRVQGAGGRLHRGRPCAMLGAAGRAAGVPRPQAP